MPRALWHMHHGTSLKERMHFRLFSIQQELCGLPLCRFCSACMSKGRCFKKGSVNVPHLRTHLSDGVVGTITVSAIVSIALCSKVQLVKSCVCVCACAPVLACNMGRSEGYYTSQCITFLHVSCTPFFPPPYSTLCSHQVPHAMAVKLEFVQSVCYVRVSEVGCLV